MPMIARRGFLKGLLAAPAVAASAAEIIKAAPVPVPAVIPPVMDVPAPVVEYMVQPLEMTSTICPMVFRGNTFEPPRRPPSKLYGKLYDPRSGGSYGE